MADELEADLVARAVEAEHRDRLGQRVVGRGDRAAVAERAEVLGREEGERRGGAERARAAAVGGRDPGAWAASSSTGTPSAAISATGATLPNRWTAITTFVFGVSAARTVSGVTQKVAGSMSQKTGLAPVSAIASAEA